jgi:hypothetical protein
MPISLRVGFVYVLVAALGGCGDSPVAKPEGVAIRGKIQSAAGTPIAGGTLLLRPVDGIHGVSAIIQKDGSFELQDSAGVKRVVPGKYRVYVSFPNPEQKALKTTIPSRYQSSEDGDSDVTVEIVAERSDLMIKLNR